jgi:hypothetical protein
MDMDDEDDTLQQVPTNSLDVQNDVIDLSMDEPDDEDEIPSFDWDTSCCELSFNDSNMNDTTRPRDTIQMMLDSEQYSFKRIDMNDVQKDGITNVQRDTVAEWMFKVRFFKMNTSSPAFNLPLLSYEVFLYFICVVFVILYRIRSWTSMGSTNNVPFWPCHTWIGSSNSILFIRRTLHKFLRVASQLL